MGLVCFFIQLELVACIWYSNISRQDPACIWYSERLKISFQKLACISIPASVSFFFSYWMPYSPLVTQFIKILEISFIAHRHRRQPIACIWYSNGPRPHFFWFSELDLFILCPSRTHLWPPLFLDFRALFCRPPTSPPLVACIWYSNNLGDRSYSIWREYCLYLIQ